MIQPMLILPHEVKGVVAMNEAIEAVRMGFREWGENPHINAPRRRVHIPTDMRDSVHQGGVPGDGATGLMTHCEWARGCIADLARTDDPHNRMLAQEPAELFELLIPLNHNFQYLEISVLSTELSSSSFHPREPS
jgi:hypothetical protein